MFVLTKGFELHDTEHLTEHCDQVVLVEKATGNMKDLKSPWCRWFEARSAREWCELQPGLSVKICPHCIGKKTWDDLTVESPVK